MKWYVPILFMGIICLHFSSCQWFGQEDFTFSPHTAITDVTTMIKSADQLEHAIKESTKPIIIKVEAPWCGNCKKMQPLFHYVAEEFHNRYLFIILEISDQKELLVSRYNITGLPTFLFFKDGKEVDHTKRIIGTTSKSTLLKTINQVFGNHHE